MKKELLKQFDLKEVDKNFKEMHGNGLPDYNSNLVNFDKYLNEFKI